MGPTSFKKRGGEGVVVDGALFSWAAWARMWWGSNIQNQNIVDDGSRDHMILPVTGTGWLDRSPTVKSGSGVMSGTASDLRFFQKLNFRERGIN